MAASPLPREPLSGSCDTSGNATLVYRAPTNFYVHAYVTVSVNSGLPQYALTLGSGQALSYGQGHQTQLGPVLLQPGEKMLIVVSGATASTAVAAQVLGWQADQPEELLPLLPLQPTAVTLQLPLGTAWTGLFNNPNPLPNVTQVFGVPVGATALLVTFNNSGAGGTLTITGVQTGTTYFTGVVAAGAAPLSFPLEGDTSLSFTNALIGGSVQAILNFLSAPTFPSNARTAFAATANGIAGVAAEAMATLIPVRAGVAGAGVTSLTVTAGKKLRLTAMVVSFTTGAAAVNVSRFYLRTNPSGAVTTASPVLCMVQLAPEAATLGLGKAIAIPLPDGFEFSGNDAFGVSHIAGAATNTEWISLLGFEY